MKYNMVLCQNYGLMKNRKNEQENSENILTASSERKLTASSGVSDVFLNQVNFETKIEKSILEKLTKNELEIQCVIHEFINTEDRHVDCLKILKHHFHDQIKEKNFFDGSQMKLVFSNLDDILKFHCKFY